LWLDQDLGVLRTAYDGWDGCTMGVQSGSYSNWKPDPSKPIDYAIADLLLSRGEGIVNDIAFAGEIGRGVPDHGIQSHVIEKLRNLVLTESGEVKSSACDLLWIYSVDRILTSLREEATNALDAGNCPATQMVQP